MSPLVQALGSVFEVERGRLGGIIAGRLAKERGQIQALGRQSRGKRRILPKTCTKTCICNKEELRKHLQKISKLGNLAQPRSAKVLGALNQPREAKKKGAHVTWHINRKIYNKNCIFCIKNNFDVAE